MLLGFIRMAVTCVLVPSQVTPYQVHSVPAAAFQLSRCVQALPPVELYSAISPARSCGVIACRRAENNEKTMMAKSIQLRMLRFLGGLPTRNAACDVFA